MPNLNISIDLLSLQGARLVEKDGAQHVVINLSKARAKAHSNGKVYLNLSAIEKKEPGQYGDTHFVKEDCSKEERESGLDLPIIGNAKPFGGARQQQPQRNQPAKSYRMADAIQDDDGGDIPFN